MNLKINVTGKVQGVWFRANTKKIADSLSIYGTVKNDKDGSVTIEASGSETEMGKFILWLTQGPELAEVESVKLMKYNNSISSGFNII